MVLRSFELVFQLYVLFGANLGCKILDNFDIWTGTPDLGSLLAVPPEWKDISALWQILGHLDAILESPPEVTHLTLFWDLNHGPLWTRRGGTLTNLNQIKLFPTGFFILILPIFTPGFVPCNVFIKMIFGKKITSSIYQQISSGLFESTPRWPPSILLPWLCTTCKHIPLDGRLSASKPLFGYFRVAIWSSRPLSLVQ